MGLASRASHTFRPQDPRNAPSWQSEALGKAIDDEDVILVHIFDVLGCGNGGTVTVACVVVARVEFVADERGAAATDVLDLSQLGILDDPACGIARVRSQNDRRAASNLLGNLVRMDMVAILLRQGNGNGSKLGNKSEKPPFECRLGTDVFEERQHLVVSRVIRKEEG